MTRYDVHLKETNVVNFRRKFIRSFLGTNGKKLKNIYKCTPEIDFNSQLSVNQMATLVHNYKGTQNLFYWENKLITYQLTSMIVVRAKLEYLKYHNEELETEIEVAEDKLYDFLIRIKEKPILTINIEPRQKPKIAQLHLELFKVPPEEIRYLRMPFLNRPDSLVSDIQVLVRTKNNQLLNLKYIEQSKSKLKIV